MKQPSTIRGPEEAGDRDVSFAHPAFETTVRGAHRFVTHAAQIPSGSPINLAFVEDISLEERLAAIDALLAAGLVPRPIISTRRIGSSTELSRLLHEVVERRGIEDLLVVGGDPAVAAGPFGTALELLTSTEFNAVPLVSVGLPGFPDNHPVLPPKEQLDLLQAKVAVLQEAGRSVEITTQICLDPLAVLRWIEAVRSRGILAPIRVGIPAPSTVQRLLRFSELCRVDTRVDDVLRHDWMLDGESQATDPGAFIETLDAGLPSEQGAVGVHAYPMGDLPGTLRWLRAHAPGGGEQ